MKFLVKMIFIYAPSITIEYFTHYASLGILAYFVFGLLWLIFEETNIKPHFDAANVPGQESRLIVQSSQVKP